MYRIGTRVVLSPLGEPDAPYTLELRTDVEGQRELVGFPYPVTLDTEREWIRTLYPPGPRHNVYLAIREKESSTFLGYLSARNIDAIHRHADFGIILLERYRGKGYAKEAMVLFLDYLFADLHLHRVQLHVLASNERAAALYAELGFVREGLLRDHAWIDGEYRPMIVMSILSEEFRRPNA